MNDETRQMREKFFDHIVLGLIITGLITALSALGLGGFSSPWFFRAVALIIVALVALGLRRISQFVVAAYVLVLELFGIVTAILIQAGAPSFIPYLFVPIVIITGLMLSPTATVVVSIASIAVVLMVVALTQQFSWATFIPLLPPFSLTIIATLLAIEGRQYIEKIGDHLLESRKLLRERTLEMMDAQEHISQLQTKTETLKQQMFATQSEAQQAQQASLQRNQGLYGLIKGTLNELDSSVEDLERIIDQISESSSAEEQAGLLEKVWQRIYHLNNLVVNLEDLAQLKNEQTTLNYQQVDVANLINEVVGATRGLARGKNVEIRHQIPDDLPDIQLDPIRLRQALLYILNNAIKYTDQGIIEVQAELNAKELLLFVSDTGIGMHREEMDIVFQEFKRGSGSLAQERGGTGLGLAISKALVELHGGHMWVTSVLGVGSTFYINIPLEPPVSQAAVPTPMFAPEPQIASIPVEPTPVSGAMLDEATSDDDETLLSSEPATLPAGTKRGFGSPVGRYSPTYIGRFGFILLGLLLIIASIVAMLAIIYGPVEQDIAASKTATGTAETAIVTTPTAESIALLPTDTPSATPVNEVPSTNPPVNTATDTPAAIPTDTPTTVPVDTATPIEPSPLPNNTATSTNTPVSTATREATRRATPTAVTATDVQEASTRPPAKGLSFVTGQVIGQQSLTNGSDINADVLGPIVPDSNVSWSPDGKRVLFTTRRDGNYEIYMATADGSQIVNLTKSIGYDSQPAWSPDGRKIAFSSERGGNVDIYVMNADGSDPQQITTGRGYEEWPVWSPDGRNIVYVSDQDGNIEIYVIGADGSNPQRITDNPAADWPAAWSPDGRKLVFSSNRAGNWNLYVIDALSGEMLPLTDDASDEREPVWSPDGRTIAFVSNSRGNWDIFTLPAPTGTTTIVSSAQWTQFTNTPDIDEHYPTWSP